MKKVLIALLCIILTSGSAMAQKKFTFGPKAGVDLTHFWGKDLPHLLLKVGKWMLQIMLILAFMVQQICIFTSTISMCP